MNNMFLLTGFCTVLNFNSLDFCNMFNNIFNAQFYDDFLSAYSMLLAYEVFYSAVNILPA